MAFYTKVSIKENPRINDWLRRVETEMRNTRARMRAQSVQDYAAFKKGAEIDQEEYMRWRDKYPVQSFGFF